MTITKGFIFNYSKCVGCHACMVACYNENGTKLPLSWRQINHFNREKLPLLGFVHQSIACNHCKEAPCVLACPSKAYSKDLETGAVIHAKEICIGCKYCTWACPFNAPKYNTKEGIIEKCHFCFHRLKEGEVPSCALNCPTGALSFGEFNEMPNPDSFGLSERNIYPRIKVIGSEVVNSIPELDLNASGIDKTRVSKLKVKDVRNEVNPLHELPLALFTLISSLITGWFWSGLFKYSIVLNLWIFLSLGALAMALSTFHLGKPFRAYLSIKNIKSSWLSREILLFGLFMLTGLIALYSKSVLLLYVSSLIGGIFLVSIEMVYSITKKLYKTPIHSANTIVTALTFTALFSQSWSILIVLLALKTVLFTIRTGATEIGPRPLTGMIALARLITGFLIPFGFLAFSEMNFSWLIAVLIISGELIDRILYYGDFKPERPLS